jgi:hypothetical protein
MRRFHCIALFPLDDTVSLTSSAPSKKSMMARRAMQDGQGPAISDQTTFLLTLIV